MRKMSGRFCSYVNTLDITMSHYRLPNTHTHLSIDLADLQQSTLDDFIPNSLYLCMVKRLNGM